MKPKLRQNKGNVYHTPVETPASTPRQAVKSKGLFPQQSDDNVSSWLSVFREIGNECGDLTKRKRRKNT